MVRRWNGLGGDTDALGEIIELAVDGIISIDRDQKIVLFNKGAEKLFGYPAAEMLGQDLGLLLPEQARDAHRQHVGRFGDSGQTARMMSARPHLCGRTRDGREIPLDVSIQQHRGDGKIRFTAICRDISHRLTREQTLTEHHAKFEALFNSSNRLIILLDEQGRVLNMNNTAEAVLGPDEARCAGQKIWACAFWREDVDRALLKHEIGILKRTGFGNLSARIMTGGGQDLFLDISLRKFCVGDGGGRLIVLEAMDVTRIVEANEALKKSEGRLARAQQIAHLGNWEWNITTNELYWSDEVYRIFGRSPNSFGASYPAFLQTIHEEDRKKVEDAVENTLKSGRPYSIIHRIICPDGTEKVVHELGEVLRNEQGEPLHMTGTVQDISESWHREKALARARNQAEAANKAKSQFLATMSHELRTPLNAIIGFSSTMKAGIFGDMDPQYQEYAAHIEDSGKHLLSLINDILDLSRIEVGAVEVRPDWLTPERLIRKSLKFISSKAAAKNITLTTAVEADISDLYLDERLCDQILINLLANAVKFTDCGGEVIAGARLTGHEVEIYVRDTGIGMTAEDIEKIFLPFAQADMSYARNHEGVGLGLAIVKNLTELQKGRVEIASTPGEGTCVSVFFPVKARLFS